MGLTISASAPVQPCVESSSPAASPRGAYGTSCSCSHKAAAPAGTLAGSSRYCWPTTTVGCRGRSPASASAHAMPTPAEPSQRWISGISASRGSRRPSGSDSATRRPAVPEAPRLGPQAGIYRALREEVAVERARRHRGEYGAARPERTAFSLYADRTALPPGCGRPRSRSPRARRGTHQRAERRRRLRRPTGDRSRAGFPRTTAS